MGQDDIAGDGLYFWMLQFSGLYLGNFDMLWNYVIIF